MHLIAEYCTGDTCKLLAAKKAGMNFYELHRTL